MKLIYLDLNVFDQIEKIERLNYQEAEPYQLILDSLQSGTLTTVYTNAHISDLIRAYKSPSGDTTQLEGHLQHISTLTNNNFMCLYGQQSETKLERKDVFEVFNSSLEDSLKPQETSFSGLIDSITSDVDLELVDAILNKTIESMTTLVTQAFPDDFMKAFEFPLYQKMFPITYSSGDMKNMFDDLLTLNTRIGQDPEMYRDLKRMMNPDNFNEFAKMLPPGQTIDKKELKKSLKKYDIDSMLETYAPDGKTSDHPWYDKITNLYSKIDFKGFKTDKDFDNMIDDSNHTFYGSHCYFFITEDTRCHYKATEVYKQLNIPTKVFTPKEFLQYVKSLQSSADGALDPLP
ncbi:hypothetical protein [Fluviicola sp.]|uniref:hypothetical protein n=1 Tax=Fluviicola sp. TaxID=1917219 RepID=UPI0031CE5FAD